MMSFEENVRAVLNSNFAETKDEIIEIAVKCICNLVANLSPQGEWIPVSEGLRCGMNSIYILLDEMRESIISMDLPYSRTTELLNQISEIEKAVDSAEYLKNREVKNNEP